MKKRRMTVSPSQLDSMSCRFAWFLQYKRGYKPKKSNINLEFGTGIHFALEKYYGEKADPVAVFKNWADNRIKVLAPVWKDDIVKLKDAKGLGIAMLEGYVKEYDGKDDFDIISTEKTIWSRLPVPGKGGKMSMCYLVARLDALVRDHSTGNLFSLEHKTFSKFVMSQLERDHQFCAQAWLGRHLVKSIGLDEPIVGVIYNGLRKQKPGPKVKLKLFERHKIYKTENHIRVFLHRAYWQYRDMNRKDLPIFPQPNNIRCGMCDYQEVCSEYQRGGDWKYLLKTMYTRRKN